MAEKRGDSHQARRLDRYPQTICGWGGGRGVHGRNRLMGNSLLEITVYGRRAGKAAAQRAREVELGELTLDHLRDWERQLKEAHLEPRIASPLLLPDYTRHTRPAERVI